MQTQSYGAEARGTAAWSSIVVDEKEIARPIPRVYDVFVALTKEAFEKFISRASKKALVAVDKDLVGDVSVSLERKLYAVPFTKIAEDSVGSRLPTNMVVIGFVVGATNVVNVESVKLVLEKMFKGKILEANTTCLELGFKEALSRVRK